MYKMTSYLVCHDKIDLVKTFLAQFLEEHKEEFNHSEWITFKIPNSELTLNLMAGRDQLITQNFTLEIQCKSFNQLEELASDHGRQIHSFDVTKTE